MIMCAVIGAWYSREAAVYAKEQVDLAKKQVQLQQETSNDTLDAALKQILEEMRNVIFTLNGKHQNPNPKRAKTPSRDPTDGNAPSESRTKQFKPERKAKASDVRRLISMERRNTFGGARSR
jgi:hypothetical protein